MTTEINMTFLRTILADYSEIDALKEKLFNRETSPFYIGGEYDEWRKEQIEETIDYMLVGKVREILNKIGIPNIISMMSDEFGNQYMLDFEKEPNYYGRMLAYIIKEHIMEQEIAETMADMIQNGEWSEEEEVDSDEASDAETDEDY